METPRGMRKQAATVFIPVRSVTVAEPPKISIAIKKSQKLVGARLAGRWRLTGNDNVGRKGKKQKHKVSNSAPSSLDDFKIGMTKGSVLLKLAGDHGKEKDLDGSTGSVPPRTTDTKFVSAHSEHHTTTDGNDLRTYAVALDCKRVAAHVQALTIPAAIKPGGTLRLAELNSSAEEVL